MTHDEFVTAVEANSKRVFLTALSFAKNRSDAEDIMQNVFLKLWQYDREFQDEEHISKWLTVVTSNESKNYLKSVSRRKNAELTEEADDFAFPSDDDKEIFNAVMSLSPKLSSVVHLFYYEDMSVSQIAESLGIRQNVVKTRLSRARAQLKEKLGDDWLDE